MDDRVKRILLLPEKIPNIPGVIWVPKQGWRATLYRHGKKYNLGHYGIKSEAVKVLKEARDKHDLKRIKHVMSKEDLDQKLAEFIEENGRRPTSSEFRKYRLSIAKYYRTFTNMLFENGIEVKVRKPNLKYSDELLFKEAWALYEKLGRVPQHREFKYKYAIERFGTWRNFLLKAGFLKDPEEIMHNRWSPKLNEEKTQRFVEYLVKTNEKPLYSVALKAKINPISLTEQYGSWQRFQEEILFPLLEAEKELAKRTDYEEIKKQRVKARELAAAVIKVDKDKDAKELAKRKKERQIRQQRRKSIKPVLTTKSRLTYYNTTQEDREKIVLDCLALDKDYVAMTIKYNIEYRTIYDWVKKYEKLGFDGLKFASNRQKANQAKD